MRFNGPWLGALTRRQGRLGLIGALLMALSLAGCSGEAPAPDTNRGGPPQAGNSPSSSPASNSASNPPSSPVKKEGNYITAEPNPVPAGTGAGTTRISWGVIEKPADVEIYLSADDGKETIFAAAGGPGAQDAPWINKGKYEFRLYSKGANRRLLDKVVVTRQY